MSDFTAPKFEPFVVSELEKLPKNETRSFFELPALKNSEEAERFGLTMTRDQWLLCEGAKQALQREFDLIGKEISENRSFTDRKRIDLDQIRADLAAKISLFREAQELAPFPTLVRLLKS